MKYSNTSGLSRACAAETRFGFLELDLDFDLLPISGFAVSKKMNSIF